MSIATATPPLSSIIEITDARLFATPIALRAATTLDASTPEIPGKTYPATNATPTNTIAVARSS